MKEITSACRVCGFENPRIWQTCARCGQSLNEEANAQRAGFSPFENDPTLEDESEITLVGPAPEFVQPPSSEDLSLGSETSDERETPLIGQSEAALAIQTGIERAFTVGSTTLVALEGAFGSGKTRLLVFASEIAARITPDVRVLYAVCRKGGDGTYAPFSRLLLERFGITPSSSLAAVRGQMSTVVQSALQTSEAITVAETTHLLGHLAGIPFPDSPFLARLEKNPAELHRHTCAAIRRFIEGEAQSRPVLLLLDNMHYAEESAWEMLEELCKVKGHLAIVLAGDQPISEHASQLDVPGGLAIGPIVPFSQSEISSMLHVLLPDLKSAPEPLTDALMHRSEGNPSAVRELVFALWEVGLFLRNEEDELYADVDRLQSAGLPVSMEDAVRARIERLNAFEANTLERAAVVGNVFWDGALLGQMRSERIPPKLDQGPLSIWPNDDDMHALSGALKSLEEKGFIVAFESSDISGAREFSFVLRDVRQILYDRIDDDLRIQRHAAVARWLALIGQTRWDRIASMIAPHLELAGQSQRAGRAYLKAAIYEHANLRTLRALRSIEHALKHIEEDDIVRRIEALHEYGSLLYTLGRYDEAADAFTDMFRKAWSVGSRSKGGAALNRLARAQHARGEDANARQLLERALELFRSVNDLHGIAATLDDLAQIDMLRERPENVIPIVNEALEIRQKLRDRRGEAVSLHTLGQVEIQRGHHDIAEQYFRSSLKIREAIHNHEGILQSHNGLAAVAYECGDHQSAIRAWSSALQRARKIADRRSECYLLNNIGEAQMMEGAFEAASNALEQAFELATKQNDKRAIAEIRRNQASLALLQGQKDTSELMVEAATAAKEYGGMEVLALTHRTIGQFRAQTLFDTEEKSGASAEEAFVASIQAFQQLGNEKEATRSLAELAKHLVEKGQIDAARQRFQEAREISSRLGQQKEVTQIDEWLQRIRY